MYELLVRETFKILYINKMGNYATKTELSAQVDAINARLSEIEYCTTLHARQMGYVGW
jgi:hypothetical protein